MYKDRDREKNLGSKLLSVMIILFLKVVWEVIDVVVGHGHVGEQVEGLGGAQGEGQGHQGGGQGGQGHGQE